MNKITRQQMIEAVSKNLEGRRNYAAKLSGILARVRVSRCNILRQLNTPPACGYVAR